MFIAADSRLLQAFWPFGPQKSRATNMQIDNTIHMFCFCIEPLPAIEKDETAGS